MPQTGNDPIATLQFNRRQLKAIQAGLGMRLNELAAMKAHMLADDKADLDVLIREAQGAKKIVDDEIIQQDIGRRW